MNLYLLQQYKFINDLYKNENWLDILISIDDFLDILNIYAFPGWLDAEVVDMKMMKYFVSITIKTLYKKPPSGRAAVILTKYGCQVSYKESVDYVPSVEETDESDNSEGVVTSNGKKQKLSVKKEKVWLVDILIPSRHLISDEIYDLEAAQKIQDEVQDDNDNLDNAIVNQDTSDLGQQDIM